MAFSGTSPSRPSIFVPHGQPSYLSIAQSCMGPKGAALADVAMALSCFGFATSYLISIGEVMPDFVRNCIPNSVLPHWLQVVLHSRIFWQFIFLIAISPVVFAQRVEDFAWFPSLCLSCALYLFALVFYYRFTLEPQLHASKPMFAFNLAGFKTLRLFNLTSAYLFSA